jgi:hypothetical protein
MIFSLLAWGLVLPVQAASLKTISDTLSDSDLSAAATHTISFEATTASLAASSTITYTFSSDWGGLDAITDTGISAESGLSAVAECTGAASEALVSTSATVLTLEVCTGDTISAGTKSLVITGMTNPSSPGSQLISIAYGSLESGATRVAIIDDVVVSAAVGTSFTFVISALTSGSVNGASETCIAGTTATAIPYGTLTASTPLIACQQLTVATNAKNGFVVTVKQDQALTSASGADIDLFKDGTPASTPTAWTAPANTLDSEDTYGHMGITSEDSDLNGDEFGSALFAGNLVSAPRTVFSHNKPANGSTADKGLTKVGYKIEVSALQEAADDYSASLTYVATPTF